MKFPPRLSDPSTGGLFHSPSDDVAAYAWDYAIGNINDDRAVLVRSRLTPARGGTVLHRNSFMASKEVCKLFEFSLSPVVALFGPQEADIAEHVQNVAEVLNVPHVETR